MANSKGKIILPGRGMNPAMMILNQERRNKENMETVRVISLKFGFLVARTVYTIILITSNEELNEDNIKDIDNKVQKILADEEIINCGSIDDIIKRIKELGYEVPDHDTILKAMPALEGYIEKDEENK